jgi:hypothetical protein
MQPRRPPGLIWYAGYGSNLCAERFRCYIAGGIPPGLTDPCRGARDPTHPRQDRPLDIPHPLYFAGTARPWGGSPCFVDPVPGPEGPTRGRAYLITWEQFEDVVAQENGRPTSPVDLDLAEMTEGDSLRIGPGRYETLLYLGRLEGLPVVTITSPRAMTDPEPGAPSAAYLKVMITGLREAHAMSDDAIVAYLGSARGCSEALVVSALGPRPGAGAG